MTIAEQIKQVRLNIDTLLKEAHNPVQQSIRLLAVSKTHSAKAIQAAYAAGITEFGENYLQESLEKINACQKLPITWHFIGPIQSNKTRAIAESFDWVQSIDRVKTLNRLNAQRPESLAPLQICIQVNFFNESQKRGVTLDELSPLLLLAQGLPNVNLRGLMVIPPKQTEMKAQLKQFNQISEIFNQLKQTFISMDTLSMGMSNDIRAAIMAGSNMVRVGTAIFGPRGTK